MFFIILCNLKCNSRFHFSSDFSIWQKNFDADNMRKTKRHLCYLKKVFILQLFKFHFAVRYFFAGKKRTNKNGFYPVSGRRNDDL